MFVISHISKDKRWIASQQSFVPLPEWSYQKYSYLSPRPARRGRSQGLPLRIWGCSRGCPWDGPKQPQAASSSSRGSPWRFIGVRRCRLWHCEHKQRGEKFEKRRLNQHSRPQRMTLTFCRNLLSKPAGAFHSLRVCLLPAMTAVTVREDGAKAYNLLWYAIKYYQDFQKIKFASN